MVRVFKCHSFASQHVIPVHREPLAICAVEDKLFVATTECEIHVYKISQGTPVEFKTLPSISEVDKIMYNCFRNYIVTVELKKSWKHVTHSVRVYLNWEAGTGVESKSRIKVRVAEKSHVQHVSALTDPNMVDIIEVPVDCHATSIAVCRFTGNFAVACGSEVKLCSIVEKTVANTQRTYLDVEIFLELCWNFPVLSISLCEEFIICCSKTEVQGVKVRYVDRQQSIGHGSKRSPTSPIASSHQSPLLAKESNDNLPTPSTGASPQSFISDTFMYPDFSIESSKESDIVARIKSRLNGVLETSGDLSNVGMRSVNASTKLPVDTLSPTMAENDCEFEEWNFHQSDRNNGTPTISLPGLPSNSSRGQSLNYSHTVCPPVLSDYSGRNVKSISGADTETVIYLSDSQEKEEWISVSLVPTYLTVPSQNLYQLSSGTDRMKSFYHDSRINICCFISGSRGGYLYQLSPCLKEISAYQYSDKASKVSCGKNHLHVATDNGIETYTSRWATVALESTQVADSDEQSLLLQVHPPINLDVCLCGHEPFMGVVDLSVGNNFLALLSKVQDPTGSDETAWSLYIIHSYNTVEQFSEMMQFAEAIQTTGPSSYIHLLQEAHLLMSTDLIFGLKANEDTIECLQRVRRLLGDFYSQPGQEGWRLCSAYYKSLNEQADVIVAHAKSKTKGNEYGKGIIDYLENLLFSDVDESLLPSKDAAADVLEMFFFSAPEKLSKIILLSRLTDYKTEVAFTYLQSLFDEKAVKGQLLSTIDKLAMTLLLLDLCDVEMAYSQLESITSAELIHVCLQHPKLIHTDLNTFTPLAQLLRRRKSVILLDVLIEMLDECVISLDTLLMLLKSQDEVDILHNVHIKEILELVLTDEKRLFLFESVANQLCEIYITQIKEGKTNTVTQSVNQGTLHKFTLPQGNGHFAPRYGWLDELPPFHDSDQMHKPCQYLEVKHVHGQSSPATTKQVLPQAVATGVKEKCPCCHCNGNLLKLQSLLCSPRLSEDLAYHILESFRTLNCGAKGENDPHDNDDDDMDEIWSSVILLCDARTDIQKAMQRMVDQYPKAVAKFASTCLHGDVSLYSDLMRRLENVMKNSPTTYSIHSEKVYVTAYKDLLNKASELFTPTQFMELLPSDGKLIFFLPYLVHNLELEHVNSLKCKIIDLGSELFLKTN